MFAHSAHALGRGGLGRARINPQQAPNSTLPCRGAFGSPARAASSAKQALTPRENRPVVCGNIRPFFPRKMFPNSARRLAVHLQLLACLFNTPVLRWTGTSCWCITICKCLKQLSLHFLATLTVERKKKKKKKLAQPLPFKH